MKPAKAFQEETKTDYRAPERVEPRQTSGEDKGKDFLKKGDALGKLYGWLVSYQESNGSSIEMREGRFFVSSSQLRSTDLVLDDSTISTPHALFTISQQDGIAIQDLKSDRGVFVRENGSSAYRREYDTSALHHGDWVRFGDLEFLVSIIANVDEK